MGLLWRTRAGLILRAAGEGPEVLEIYGTSATKVRWLAVLFGGAMAGIGGAQLSTASTLNWSEQMTVGRGYVAVALVIFAGWVPYKLHARRLPVQRRHRPEPLPPGPRARTSPSTSSSPCPTSLVLVVLALLSRRRIHGGPAALEKVFEA